jgi:hypothetical protein
MEEIVTEIFNGVPNSPPPHGSCTMFYEIIIYKSGKIEIITYSNSPKSLFLKIEDNIPIPEYIIELFKMLFNSGDIYNHHILHYIKVLQKFKEDYAIIHKKKKLVNNQLKIENQQLKEENVKLNKSYKYFNKSGEETYQLKLQLEQLKKNETLKSTIKEENEQYKLQIVELIKENDKLKLQIEETEKNKLQIEHLKKENEELKLQIRETKINHIINYYC